ncbi:hypothetical protein AM501_09785 [Aneurinibacillus migulanus]|uniref:hypothetical protein n=1 Tax=Aneurinibacillus migulanus TaxID=47500 RepID=UPI0005BDF964|nr:hypothetical protein [Aneurinibacillus migulanus]KIV56435.1 hypothetical protein TS64_09200 [Aneurinibacillus migulanus]KPD08443.1 hypothetical protein AM501_09785 [Aneurinibacillus migulanus]
MNTIKLTVSLKNEKLKEIFDEKNIPFTEENVEKFLDEWKDTVENTLENDIYNLIKGNEFSIRHMNSPNCIYTNPEKVNDLIDDNLKDELLILGAVIVFLILCYAFLSFFLGY